VIRFVAGYGDKAENIPQAIRHGILRDGVTVFQQIEWGGRKFVITGPPEEIFRRKWLLVQAEKITSGDFTE
jgi:hypothetical protein